jgi:hypothetical protein
MKRVILIKKMKKVIIFFNLFFLMNVFLFFVAGNKNILAVNRFVSFSFKETLNDFKDDRSKILLRTSSKTYLKSFVISNSKEKN